MTMLVEIVVCSFPLDVAKMDAEKSGMAGPTSHSKQRLNAKPLPSRIITNSPKPTRKIRRSLERNGAPPFCLNSSKRSVPATTTDGVGRQKLFEVTNRVVIISSERS